MTCVIFRIQELLRAYVRNDLARFLAGDVTGACLAQERRPSCSRQSSIRPRGEQ